MTAHGITHTLLLGVAGLLVVGNLLLAVMLPPQESPRYLARGIFFLLVGGVWWMLLGIGQ